MMGRGFTTSIIQEWNEWVYSVVQEIATELGERFLIMHVFDPENGTEKIIAKDKKFAIEYTIPITSYTKEFRKNREEEKEKIINFFLQAVAGK